MDSITWLAQHVPSPYSFIISASLAALAVAFYLIVGVSSQQAARLRRRWWVFAAIVAVAATTTGMTAWSLHRPLTKPTGTFRLLVGVESGDQLSSAVRIAVMGQLERLIGALHVAEKVEVLPAARVGAAGEAERLLSYMNGDALLWVRGTAPSTGTAVLYPELRVYSSPARAVRRVELSQRRWTGAAAFASAVEQMSIECLEVLDPVLPDWGRELPLQRAGPGPETLELPRGRATSVTVRMGLHVWPYERLAFPDPDNPQEPLVLPGRERSKSLKIPITMEGDARSPTRTVHSTGTVRWTEPQQFRPRACVTYALYAFNGSDQDLRDVKLTAPWPKEVLYLPGMLTMNGEPVSEEGGPARVDRQARRVVYEVGKLGPQERVFATYSCYFL